MGGVSMRTRVRSLATLNFRSPAFLALIAVAGVCVLALEFLLAPNTFRHVHRAVSKRAYLLRNGAPQTNVVPSGGAEYIHDLFTPEYKAYIESQKIDSLNPVQVHLLWIGDVEKAPAGLAEYPKRGYNFTMHTSIDEVLEGFHPYVRKAYELAIPEVVGFDFLKFLLLYKYGGFVVDADTTPQLHESKIYFPDGCTMLFGKEAHMPKEWFTKPQYRQEGGATYPLIRPYQLLNWAMGASAPMNDHIRRLIEMCMMRFFGLRDMEYKLIQDIAGSGLMSDYFALVYERAGLSYPAAFDDPKIVPVEGACMADDLFTYKWIFHHYLGSWKLRQNAAEQPENPETAEGGNEPASSAAPEEQAKADEQAEEQAITSV